MLSSSSKIIPLRREFGYDSSSKKRHFPKSIQAVLGQLSHQDCKGVIVVLKEESTREITVKVSPTDKTARCQRASKRQQRKKRPGTRRTGQERGHREPACSVQKLPQPANQSGRQDAAPAGNKFRFGQVRDGGDRLQPMSTEAYLGKWRWPARTWGGLEGAWRVR